jgi:hypothetical protein
MTNTKSLPSVDYLRKRLRYEPETGKLFWLDYEGMPQRWLTRWAGKEAFTAYSNGYLIGGICGVMFLAHRVAYAIHYGEWPDDQIDHINGVRRDNRISNLRVVNHQENLRNANMKRNNTSGITGVVLHKSTGKWLARICVGYRRIHIGYFDTLEEATAARKEAAAKYGFTERHGTKAE